MNLHLRMFLMLAVLTLPACSGGGSNDPATESPDSTELTPEEIEYEKNLDNQK